MDKRFGEHWLATRSGGFKLKTISAPIFDVPDKDESKILFLAKESGMPIKELYFKDEADKLFQAMKDRIMFLEKSNEVKQKKLKEKK